MDNFEDNTPNPFAQEASPAPSESRSSSPGAGLSTSSKAQPKQLPSAPSSVLSAASGSPPPTERASFPNPGTKSYVGPKVKSGPCCERDADLQGGADISIVDAQKTTEGGKASYITYVIRTGTHETRRRYSAFDSLRASLVALYPVLIVPPIPSKQSLADYAVKGQSKAKEDATVIARRIRMLEDFLRRVARHPILGGEHVFHRFLEEGVSWSEVLHSPPLSLLPKNPLHAPSHNPTLQAPTNQSGSPNADSPNSPSEYSSSTPYIAHHLLPSPSASTPLKQPDQRFLDSEAFTDRFATHLSGSMEKINRRVVKRWGEMAHDKNELGAVLNGYSLSEVGALGTSLEKVGQAVDAEYMSTSNLLQSWEKTTTEPLHIYAQYAQIIRQRLAFRHQKHVQYELVQETLEAQRDKLEILEKAEKEARRLEEALESGGRGLTSSMIRSDEELQAERERASRRKTASGGGYGFLSAVKHSIGGMMDVDPEATRRANIGKCRDAIGQLEDSLQASAQDLKYASMTLQADLDRFQRQKVADLRDMAIALAGVHRDWCRHNLKAWQEAQVAIDAIEPHPNQQPANYNTASGSTPPAAAAAQYPSSTASTPNPNPVLARSDTTVTIRPESVANAEREVTTAAGIPLPLPENTSGSGGDSLMNTTTASGLEQSVRDLNMNEEPVRPIIYENGPL